MRKIWKYKRDIERSKRKHNFSKRVKIIFISLIMIVLVILGTIIIRTFYKSQTEVKYDNYKLYQYFSGLKVEYDGKVKIERNKEITSIKSKKKKINMENIPIYFQNDKNKVLFPENIELIYLRNKAGNYRLNYFTKLEIESDKKNTNAFVEYKGKKKFIEKSFLYDGENMYFFPYETDVVIENKTYNLSPLSYIIVNYKDSIELYDKKTDKYDIIEDHEKDVIANIGNYKVNLSTDMIMYKNDNRILIKKTDRLPLFNFDK